jgi:hypothetical protein
LSYEYLYQEYVVLGKALPEIQAQLGLDSCAAIYRTMLDCGIPVRVISESRKMPRAKTRFKAGCQKSMGVDHNFCKGSASRLSWEARLLEDEGITNVFQREDVKTKIKDSFEANWGTRNLWDLPEYRSRVLGSKYSTVHRQVVEWLQNQGVPVEVEVSLVVSKGHRVVFDAQIKGTKILLEINGDLWHANPEIYKAGDFIPVVGKTAQALWDRDVRKTACAISQGFTVTVLWERDIRKSWGKVVCQLQELIKDVARTNPKCQEDHPFF